MDNVWFRSRKAHQTVSKHFTKAIRVMKLDPHNEAVEHFKNLTKHPETTAEFLQNLKHSDLPEYHSILGYLEYWSKEH